MKRALMVLAMAATSTAPAQEVDNAVKSALGDAVGQTKAADATPADQQESNRRLAELTQQLREVTTQTARKRQEEANRLVTEELQRLADKAAASSARATSSGSVKCRKHFDFSSLKLKNFSDSIISATARELQSASVSKVVADAKAAGYTQAQARRTATATATYLRKKSDQAFASAAGLSSDGHSPQYYKSNGLPADYKCSGAASAAICAAMVDYWTSVSADQTAEVLQCNW